MHRFSPVCRASEDADLFRTNGGTVIIIHINVSWCVKLDKKGDVWEGGMFVYILPAGRISSHAIKEIDLIKTDTFYIYTSTFCKTYSVMMIQQQTSASISKWKQSTVNTYIRLKEGTEGYEYVRFHFKYCVLRIDVLHIEKRDLFSIKIISPLSSIGKIRWFKHYQCSRKASTPS